MLLKFVPVKQRIGRIYIPDAAGSLDTHRMGVVEVLGSKVKGDLKLGDTVIFQVNDVMKWAQVYRRMQTGDDLLYVLESELIARVTGGEVRPETLDILGHYVLFEPKVKPTGSSLVLPPGVGLTPEFVRYTLEQKGPLVDLPIHQGQELIINHGRISPLLVQFQNQRGETETKEYGYTSDEWVSGCVEEAQADGGPGTAAAP